MERTLGTGDLLLFARSSYQSHWFRAMSDSPLEHSGVAIRLTVDAETAISLGGDLRNVVVPPGQPFDPMTTHVYILDQMMRETDRDILTGKLTPGFRICEYASRVRNYRWVVCRPLRYHLPFDPEEFKESFHAFCQKHRGELFMKGFVNIVRFWVDGETSPDAGMTCTMLTASFIRDVLQFPVKLNLAPHHFLPDSSDGRRQRLHKIYDDRLATLEIVPEDISQTVTPLIVITVLWLVLGGLFYRKIFR